MSDASDEGGRFAIEAWLAQPASHDMLTQFAADLRASNNRSVVFATQNVEDFVGAGKASSSGLSPESGTGGGPVGPA